MFADADTDRILGRSVPANVWLTDKRDLEGYVLRLECIEKVIKFGFLNDRLDANSVLQQVASIGWELGVLRLMSEVDGRDLPFQRTDVARHFTMEVEGIRFNLQGYTQALLQNGDISVKALPEVIARHHEVAEEYSHFDDAELVHGKDAVVVLERLFRAHGLQSNETGRLLRCTYERQWIENHSSLEQAYEFLTAS